VETYIRTDTQTHRHRQTHTQTDTHADIPQFIVRFHCKLDVGVSVVLIHCAAYYRVRVLQGIIDFGFHAPLRDGWVVTCAHQVTTLSVHMLHQRVLAPGHWTHGIASNGLR
jgi:hypothetical protein